MQKPLKIDYRCSRLPFMGLLSVAGFTLLAIVVLQPKFAAIWLALLIVMLVIAWRGLASVGEAFLEFDGKVWWVTIESVRQQADILPCSFFSPYYIVLVFRLNKTIAYLHFARDNCSEADFRALSRLR